ncbi:hypothetical protein Catovirus_1_1004 [Catovirus CTV1]|mgnify:CR=1 FL=1|uniref:Uncharacterized protein n=1 Tax=Catovirus CTV1 TaxID=1977631 RepID=A0A1V0SBA7_9VIRU|nr:hypothetical protein Catovirus_1_1004 [Catovirus CTV1]
MQTDEIRIFCSNLKSARSNVTNGYQKNFVMKSRDTTKSQYILIPLKSINEKEYFSSNHLGKFMVLTK